MTDRIWTAALLVIGDEILSGRTQDKNVAQLATWLNVQGIRLAEVRVVADREEAIVEAVNTLRARNDYLFTTGGIGPTHDDITVDSIAEALSARELEVLLLLDDHLATDEIATRLFISEHTVRSHVKSLLRKLGVSSRREALERLSLARG